MKDAILCLQAISSSSLHSTKEPFTQVKGCCQLENDMELEKRGTGEKKVLGDAFVLFSLDKFIFSI